MNTDTEPRITRILKILSFHKKHPYPDSTSFSLHGKDTTELADYIERLQGRIEYLEKKKSKKK